MARTLADYLDIVEHAVGGQLDASIDITQLVNDAGRYLIQMHDWAFLERPVATLSTTASQAYINLPSDFDKLIDMGNTGSYTDYSVHIVPADLFEKIKASEITDVLDIYVTVEWPTQTSTAVNALAPRLAVFPTPSTTDSDRYWVNYKAGWTELSSNAAVANIPEPCEHLLIQLIRAFARGEATGQGPYEFIEAVERSAMLKRLKESYTLVNQAPMPMEGGAVQVRRRARDWRQHSTITTK